MTDNSDRPPNESDPEPAGTDCALCGKAISPSQYRSSRAVLVDESGAGPDQKEVGSCEEVSTYNLLEPVVGVEYKAEKVEIAL